MVTSCTTIQVGSTGNIVMKLQYELYKKGYDPKGIDGIFGVLTQNAVILFQTAYNLVANGIVDSLTWAALGITDCTYYPTQCISIQIGSSGDIVKVLQKELKNKGYYTGVVDGVFGLTTDTAVRLFQTNNGLVVDGEVGNLTWTALGISDCTFGVKQCPLTLGITFTIT